MSSYQEHLDHLTSEAVTSANKALDYLDGDQVKWLEELLNCEKQGIKQWRERGVYPWTTNVTKKIVTRSALSYNEPPRRSVLVNGELNEEASDNYADILDKGSFDTVMDCADDVARLLKNVIILAQAVEVEGDGERILYSVLHRGNCDVHYDFKNGRIISLMYQSAGASANGNELYHFWDDEEVVDIEVGDNGEKVLSREQHNYGMIPAAVLWDSHKPRAGFWPKASWDELVRLNEGINLYHTEVKFNERWQAFGTLFTNAQLPEGSVAGPDTSVEVISQPGETPYLEYRSPTINIEKFEEWLTDFTAGIADNWGVNLSTGGSGSADSGFKLVVEEVWNLTTRRGRLKSAEAFEKDMYKVIKAISDARSMGLPDNSEVRVDFPEPALPVNALEEWTITKEKVGLGYSPLEEEWKRDNPDITAEQIAERKVLLNQGLAVPAFAGIDTDGQS